MSDLFITGNGGVLSADIAVPEHDREVRFYSRVLSTGEQPLWRETDLMNNRGMPVIGLGERNADYLELPLQWMPHIQVADVGGSAQRALERGGKELMHARDDEGRSQWAVLVDPTGAAFGIVPIVPAESMPSFEDAPNSDGPVGRIVWLDLTVADAPSTRDFYREVIGWGVQDVAMKDGDDNYADYSMLGENDEGAAGICHARGVNEGLPPVWLIYLPVGNLAESLRRVESEGGSIIKEMKGEAGQTAYAAIRDPVGAHFALAQA